MSSRVWIGKLETDDWNDPIVDGWPVDLSEFVGRRVEIIVREIGADPESYEVLARRHAGEPEAQDQFTSSSETPVGKAPAETGTHSVSRPAPAEAGAVLYPSVRDV